MVEPDLTIATLNAEIELGQEASKFLDSDIGKYLIARSRDEVDDALERLKTIDPYNPTEITMAQVEIRVKEMALTWMLDMINQAEQAMQQLDAIDYQMGDTTNE